MDSGAINKQTLQYVLPDKGSKSHEYFLEALNKNNLNIYFNKINELINKLNSYY